MRGAKINLIYFPSTRFESFQLTASSNYKRGGTLFTIIVLLILFITFILYKKKNALTAILFVALVCAIAFLTKPSEETYIQMLEEDYFLKCDGAMTTCKSTSGTHVYSVDLYIVHNFGIFNFYRLKMWYGGGTHLREIDMIGAYHQFSRFTDR